jgi:ATP-dependent exoDNAse (exonuclease V) alpha subunit
MSFVVDNIKLDDDNPEFKQALDIVMNSRRMIYLTGKAGSGKTTFLKYIKQTTKKKTVVLAPTGVAALNAGGQTIHSFFRIPPSVFVPGDSRLREIPAPNDPDQSTVFDNFKYKKKHKNLILALELLIIDEISMVRCDLLDVIDALLRAFRQNNNPFGGVQVVMIGDAFQLPPIAQNDQWEILKEHYETPFFFSSLVMKENPPQYIELEKIYRQSDKDFIDLLNRIRVNQVTPEDIELLNSRFIPALVKDQNLNYITLATHNRIVDEINYTRLNELQTPLKVYTAITEGEFPDAMYPTDYELKLKEGAQIMFIKNDAERRFYNGKIGIIKRLEEDKIVVEIDNFIEIDVGRNKWENIRFSWNDKQKKVNEDQIGEFVQFPVKLAWAITVHKSQGLTFENVIADLSNSFSPGHVYVALSRCTSFEGLLLKSRISRQVIKTDPRVIEFASE